MKKALVVLLLLLTGCGLRLQFSAHNHEPQINIQPNLSVGVDDHIDTYKYGFECFYHGWHSRIGVWDPLYNPQFCRPTIDWTWNFRISPFSYQQDWLWNSRFYSDFWFEPFYSRHWDSWYAGGWMHYYDNMLWGSSRWPRDNIIRNIPPEEFRPIRQSVPRVQREINKAERKIHKTKLEIEYSNLQRRIDRSRSKEIDNVIREYNNNRVYNQNRIDAQPEIRTSREYRHIQPPKVSAPSKTAGSTIKIEVRRNQ